ncbi:MAG TPA: PAAR domain-containing protein [Candidatus Nanopelagicales bacterium]|nr:PAAR domain-containing protein [Candidatus Nanopelagicales bacterium]
MPPAARILDMHTCPMVNPGPVPHVGGPVTSGEDTVIIGHMPAARVGDSAKCVPATDEIRAGEPSVIIGKKDAARLGDPTVHGGVLVTGCPTVIIGSSPQAETLKTDKPFCEDCDRAQRERAAERRRQQQRQQG